jgi:toxin ParE1/3/4
VSWNIEIADAAYQDLRDIYAYIAFELRSPDDARNVLRRILSEIATLDEMPSRFRSYPRHPGEGRSLLRPQFRSQQVAHLPYGEPPSWRRWGEPSSASRVGRAALPRGR